MQQQLDELAQQLGNLLLERNSAVVTVESCTGGFIAEVLTRIPGSSSWFERGLVTYSNAAKQDLVGVQEDSLQQYGAVSGVVAKEMAVGGIQCSRADLAISVTGIAGPDGGTKGKPVGTVWMAWAHRTGKVINHQYLFPGDRQQVRIASVEHALSTAVQFLKECDRN